MASSRLFSVVISGKTISLYTICFLLYMISFTFALPVPTQNMTITVPEKATNHGDPRILCMVPTPWATIAIFYLGNFAAHAATLKTYPGEAPFQVVRAVIYALFFPTSGIVRGLNAIFRHASLEKTDLRVAARAGALCMVVRTSKWRPQSARKKKPGRGAHITVQEKSTQNVKDECWRVEEGAWVKELPRLWPYFDTSFERPLPQSSPCDSWKAYFCSIFSTRRKIHGTCKLPEIGDCAGYYGLAYVPRNAIVKPIDGGETTLSSSYSIVKATVALLQAVYASATIWKATGSQIDKYGYSAFGLMVAPYIVMSLINLLGNLLTPDYDTLFIVENDILHEARRDKAIIDGYVGKLISEDKDTITQIEVEIKRSGRALSLPQRLTRHFTGAKDIRNLNTFDTTQQRVDTTRPFRLPDEPETNVIFTCPKFERTDNVPMTKFEASSVPQTLAQRIRKKTSQPLRKWFFDQKNRQQMGIPWYSYFFFAALSMSVGCVSLIIIGVLSHFRENSSTHPQRVWTLSWLVFGIVFGILFALYSAVLEYRTHKGEALQTWQKLVSYVIALAVFAPPAVGGFIVVGQMLREYGNCVTLY